MRFMLLLYPEARTGADAPDSVAARARRQYYQELTRSGVLLALDMLSPTAAGAVRILQRDGQRETCEGPFRESSAAVGGYWVIAVRSRAEALAWATRCPLSDGDMLELRQMEEAATPARRG